MRFAWFVAWCGLVTLSVVTAQISLPYVSRFDPTVLPLTSNGTQASISGGDFGPDTIVRIGGIPAQNVTVYDNFSMSFTAPIVDVMGYYNLSLENPDGGYAYYKFLVYYTDDCPVEGMLGCNGDNTCSDCPTGALCPGGCRVWPQPGYWTPSESSGQVVACNPSSHCLGCSQPLCRNQCAAGYMGDQCAFCIPGYCKQGLDCLPCQGSSGWIVGVVIGVVVLVVAIVAFLIYRFRQRSGYSSVSTVA